VAGHDAASTAGEGDDDRRRITVAYKGVNVVVTSGVERG
jgi:hypothetical protein